MCNVHFEMAKPVLMKFRIGLPKECFMQVIPKSMSLSLFNPFYPPPDPLNCKQTNFISITCHKYLKQYTNASASP